MAGSVVGGAPAWVYVLLAGLIVLGVRRLRTREMPVVVALIPSIAFLAWSIVGAVAFARLAGAQVAALAWFGGALLGAVSGGVAPEPRAQRLAGGRVRQPGSWLPLVLYLTVFVVRFACAAWAAIDPARAVTATAVAVAVNAAMTARLVTAVARWRPVPAG